MAYAESKQQLSDLLELLQGEREAAKALDMGRLEEIVVAKEKLIADINLQPEEVAELDDLLRQIDHENRRNAFLFWTGLSWVREMMGFFGNAAMPQVYGQGGVRQTLTRGGRLLSGKV